MELDPADVGADCQLTSHTSRLELAYGGKIPIQRLQSMLAGNGANAAVAAVRLGAQAAFWTLLGGDELGNRQRAELAREGVSTQWVEQIAGAQSHQSTVLAVAGERTILVHHAPRHYELPSSLPLAAWVHLTSMGRGSESIFEDLAGYLQRTGAQLTFQPDIFQLRLGPDRARELLNFTTVICLNRQEAQRYLGAPETESSISLAQQLRALGPSIAVITDGPSGSVAVSKTGCWQIGIRPETVQVESTGAGDAFASAFSVALLRRQPLPEAMRWGTLNAESVIGQVGPQAGLLTREQLEQSLADNPHFVPQKL